MYRTRSSAPETDNNSTHRDQDDAHQTAICTWFVGDSADEATFSPQLNARSNIAEVRAVYWRCTVCFFASSIIANPGRRHMFFTNTEIPTVDGIDVDAVLRQWNVEIIKLPVTYRLPAGTVQSWGSQLYTFDIIDYLAYHGSAQRYMILDSDCLWLRSADAIEEKLDEYGVLNYEIGYDEHPKNEAINGVSRADLAKFLGRFSSTAPSLLPYCGGEFFAATGEQISALSNQLELVWPKVLAMLPGAPKEDGHMLSILFGLGGHEFGTANQFVRRMWTTFRHNNLRASDSTLTIWHLPAEKRTGFGELFGRIAVWGDDVPHPSALGLNVNVYRHVMGYPRRGPAKLLRDLTRKIREKIRR